MRFAKAIAALLLVSLCGCSDDFFTKETGGGGGGGGGGHTLYAAFSPQNGNGSLVGYTVSSVGAVTNLNLNAALGVLPSSIAITPTNQFLYVANQGGGINAFAMASDGTLTAVPNQPFVAAVTPNVLAIDPAGQILYALNAPQLQITTFNIQSDGTLLTGPVQGLTNSTLPTDLALTPSGNFLYVAGGNDTSIFQVGTDSNGNATFAQVTCSNACTGNSRAVVVHPNGAFLYVADGRGQISSFTLNSNGVPAQVGSAITGLASPVSLALDSTGNFLLAVTNGDNSLTSYSILQSGGISKVTSIQVGSSPVEVRVDPGSNTAFVANSGGNPDVSGVTVSSSGQLTAVSNAAAGGNAFAVAVTH